MLYSHSNISKFHCSSRALSGLLCNNNIFQPNFHFTEDLPREGQTLLKLQLNSYKPDYFNNAH